MTFGVWSALRLAWLPVVGLVALLALGLALDGRLGRALVWVGLGALTTLARAPTHAPAQTADPRPATLWVRVAGHPRLDDGELSLWVQVERLTRGPSTQRLALEGLLTVPMEEHPAWGLGTRLRVRGYLRPAQAYHNGAPLSATSWRLRVPSARLVDTVAAAPWHGRLAGRLQRRIRDLWSISQPSEHAGGGAALARALVLGQPDSLPPSWRAGLRRAGLGHVLAVSGLHVGLLTAMVFLVTPFLPRELRALLSIATALGYLAVVGPRPSILRATLMVGLAVAAWLLARPPVAVNTLAAAAMAMVVTAPSVVDTLSFRMTVAATAGILVLAPSLAARWHALPRLVRGPVATSFAAQIATAPLTLPTFAWLASGAWLANLLALPCLAVSLALLVLATIVGLLSAASRPFLPIVADTSASWVAWLAALPAGPWFGWPWVAPGWHVSVGTTLLLLLLLGRPRLRQVALGGLLLTLAHGSAADDPVFTMLDVGQGDALLLRDGPRAMLVDGGGWPRGDLAARVLVPALAARGVTSLEAAILTHGDRDHCRGLVDVARYVRIATLWTSHHALTSRCGQTLAGLVGQVRVARPGDELRLGAWQLTILATGDEKPVRSAGNNDRSLVVLAQAHGRRFLLTGDIERAAEARLLGGRHEGSLASDILKVAHHGSRTSTSIAWLEATRPRWALISAGAGNPYRHPAPAVVVRLVAAGAFVLRTDRDGAWDLRIRPGGRLEARSAGKPATHRRPRRD